MYISVGRKPSRLLSFRYEQLSLLLRTPKFWPMTMLLLLSLLLMPLLVGRIPLTPHRV